MLFFYISFFIYSTNEYLDYMYKQQQQQQTTLHHSYYHHLFQTTHRSYTMTTSLQPPLHTHMTTTTVFDNTWPAQWQQCQLSPRHHHQQNKAQEM